MKIMINGRDHEMTVSHSVSYEHVCELAGESVRQNPTVTFRGRIASGGSFTGELTAGQLVEPSEGMVFGCVVTGNS